MVISLSERAPAGEADADHDDAQGYRRDEIQKAAQCERRPEHHLPESRQYLSTMVSPSL